MPNVMIIQGKVENIWDDEDFARMLREKLGDDAERYFRSACDREAIIEEALDECKDFTQYCGGECSKTEEIQEHYERILHDVQDELTDWDFDDSTKKELERKRDALWKRINSEL